jgi:hypothetical protein
VSGHSSLSIQDMNPPAVLWDVDFDFFLDSERTVLEDRNKNYWLRPEVLLDAHRSAPRTPVVQIKTKPPACGACLLDLLCEGPWQEYVAPFGDGGVPARDRSYLGQPVH